jgi:hypothetical protein
MNKALITQGFIDKIDKDNWASSYSMEALKVTINGYQWAVIKTILKEHIEHEGVRDSEDLDDGV